MDEVSAENASCDEQYACIFLRFVLEVDIAEGLRDKTFYALSAQLEHRVDILLADDVALGGQLAVEQLSSAMEDIAEAHGIELLLIVGFDLQVLDIAVVEL